MNANHNFLNYSQPSVLKLFRVLGYEIIQTTHHGQGYDIEWLQKCGCL
ncbi:hypothetical protein SAMN05216556_10927 [Aequorivita viscosa]|uniref:Uncharacterized protein n=1 Tax=Aequorivita viscosa TaxID=797419 RepID=A0A1M6FYM8_9FLAO|nr:hypothetical protein SAMN05216556_10927 [Aequorivita viscosa]SHJ02724.1 hypothetical protein SAMN04487908_10888 [Aequorivita viscosa]